jgi:hypothetical protein
LKRRTLIVAGVFEVALLLVGVYYEPTCSIRGRLRGEPFFEGKSATWWSHELENWDVEVIAIRPTKHGGPVFFVFERKTQHRLDDFFQRARNAFRSKEDIAIQRAFGAIGNWEWRELTLMNGDPDALLVHFALLDDPSPKVRRFARIGLKLETANP